jgi:hypothetical protein
MRYALFLLVVMSTLVTTGCDKDIREARQADGQRLSSDAGIVGKAVAAS